VKQLSRLLQAAQHVSTCALVMCMCVLCMYVCHTRNVFGVLYLAALGPRDISPYTWSSADASFESFLSIQVVHMGAVGVPLSGRVCLVCACAVEDRQLCVLGRTTSMLAAAFRTAL
jgi:hypothetical protein